MTKPSVLIYLFFLLIQKNVQKLIYFTRINDKIIIKIYQEYGGGCGSVERRRKNIVSK